MDVYVYLMRGNQSINR